MKLTAKLPVVNPLLSHYINDYSLIEFSATDTLEPIHMPPLGCPVLLFCVSPNNVFYTHTTLTNESVVVGQLTQYTILHPAIGTKIFGVNFKPYGFYNLFGVSLKTSRNDGFPMYVLFGTADVQEIYNMLDGKEAIQDIILKVETLILKRQRKVVSSCLFDSLVDIMVQKNGLVSPNALLPGKKMERSMQRYFAKVIGVNPKTFCKIYRHKFILNYLYENPSCVWNDVVFEGFYYDYSHFHRDFKKISHSTPISFPYNKSKLVRKFVQNP